SAFISFRPFLIKYIIFVTMNRTVVVKTFSSAKMLQAVPCLLYPWKTTGHNANAYPKMYPGSVPNIFFHVLCAAIKRPHLLPLAKSYSQLMFAHVNGTDQ